MNTIVVDSEVCNGCGICVKACFVDVLRWDEANARPVVAYPEDCVQCNACELACPSECIEVIPNFEDMYWPQVI